jgi:hypothetical protein
LGYACAMLARIGDPVDIGSPLERPWVQYEHFYGFFYVLTRDTFRLG